MKTIKQYISTAEGAEQKWSIINDILDNFDFLQVHFMMEAVDWFWVAHSESEEEELKSLGRTFNENSCEYIPEADDLRKVARELLNEVIDDCPESQTKWSISTGGFEVKLEILTDEERIKLFGEDAPDDFEHSVDLTLKFVAEDSCSRFW